MKRIFVILIFLCIALSVSLVSAAPDEQTVITSFQDVIKKHIDSYKDDPRILVYYLKADPPYFPKAKWMKSKSTVSSDYTYDIQKTNSIITPYTGYLIYKMQMWTIEGEQTKEDAELNNTFCDTGKPREVRITFAYQGDKWIAKKYESSYDGTWYEITEKSEIMYARVVIK